MHIRIFNKKKKKTKETALPNRYDRSEEVPLDYRAGEVILVVYAVFPTYIGGYGNERFEHNDVITK